MRTGVNLSTHYQGTAEHAGPRWRGRPANGPASLGTPSLYAHLLDLDDELAQVFDIQARVGARQLATARVLEVEVGETALINSFDAARGGMGLLVLDGVLAFEMQVGDRTTMELLGAGDLLPMPSGRPEELLEGTQTWRVLCPTRLALLDAEFVDRVHPWPQIGQALMRRAGRRMADINVLRAITAQPRLEVRLDLLLWHLAGRWGRVEPAGIRLSLPLTHRLLGQLAAAERPSISHALARLGNCGLVTGTTADLHLHGTLETHLESLLQRTPRSLRGVAAVARTKTDVVNRS
jgi:CRP/FNR family transcriptional regulator, cyclic AMP receptor protein